MRNKLSKTVKRRFGSTYRSRTAKEAREELIANVLDRYDEERQNNSSEQAAYRAALASVGDLKEIRTECGIEKTRRIVVISVISGVAALLLAVAAVMSVFLEFWLLFAGIAVGLVPAAYCVIRLLLGSPRKGLHVTGVVVGGALAAYCAFLLLLFFSVFVPAASSGARPIEENTMQMLDLDDSLTVKDDDNLN